jgi:hypothetical protein
MRFWEEQIRAPFVARESDQVSFLALESGEDSSSVQPSRACRRTRYVLLFAAESEFSYVPFESVN